MTDQMISTAEADISCEQCREMLSDYVDREIAEAQLRCIERHLSTCPKCSTESARMAGLKNIMQHWAGVKGSGEFRQVVMQQMIRESQQLAPDLAARAVAQSSRMERDAASGPDRTGIAPAWILAIFILAAIMLFFLLDALLKN
jgi:anti-sigma factor RsiW